MLNKTTIYYRFKVRDEQNADLFLEVMRQGAIISMVVFLIMHSKSSAKGIS